MKKKTGLVVFILLISTALSAGNSTEQRISQLEEKLKNAAGQERIELLNQLAKIDLANSPQKSISLGQQALQLADRLNYPEGKANALRNLGSANRVLGNNQEALDAYQKALLIFEKLQDKKGLGAIFHDIGITYYNLSKYEKALEFIRKSLKITGELGLKAGVASCLNVIGVIYDDLGNFQQALDNYLKSVRIYEEIGDKQGYAILINNVGIIYKKLQRYDKALEYYQKALQIERELNNREGVARTLNNIGIIYEEIKEYPKSLDYLLDALKIKRKIGNKKDIASSLMNIGAVYTQLGKYDLALESQRESLNISQEIGGKRGAANSLSELGRLYLKQGKLENARSSLEQALNLTKEISAKDLSRDIYFHMSGLFSAKQDYKAALMYYQRFTNEKDEIINKESNDKIAELQTKYQVEKKEQEITLLEKNNEILKKDNKIQIVTRNAFITAFILVLIIALLLFKRYLHLFAFWKKKSYIGPYRILEQIGSGGMGVVYKASHVMDRSKSAAIKVIREEYSEDPTQRKRFMNEALLVDQLNHPHIVKVIERGEYNRKLFIAMELLQGQSLAELIQRGKQISHGDCLDIMVQLVETMASVHARGIIHRDLKPDNIILVEKDETKNFVKLLDFGLARNQTLTRLTETGEILGTLHYLPPERISRQEFSAASDTYSLGVVFYEMFTLEKPFMGEVPVDIIKQILEKDPVAPHRFRPGMPGELSDVILNMMAKEPLDRPDEEVVLNAFRDFSSEA